MEHQLLVGIVAMSRAPRMFPRVWEEAGCTLAKQLGVSWPALKG